MSLRLPIDYVYNELESWQINGLIRDSYLCHSNEWEQARLIAYIMAQVNSKKKIKPTDLLRFSWEKDEPKTTKPITAEELLRLQNRAKQMEELWQTKE